MPKREPTPPLADDTKYLSVMNPYPLHCNPVIPDEIQLFAKWVTACIPQDDLPAVYYRPKVRVSSLTHICLHPIVGGLVDHKDVIWALIEIKTGLRTNVKPLRFCAVSQSAYNRGSEDV